MRKAFLILVFFLPPAFADPIAFGTLLASGATTVRLPNPNANQAEQMFEGQAMMDWNGQIYRKGS